jgi:hypothetical protein
MIIDKTMQSTKQQAPQSSMDYKCLVDGYICGHLLHIHVKEPPRYLVGAW